MYPGSLIVFESVSKCGKTTLSRMLWEHLRQHHAERPVMYSHGAPTGVLFPEGWPKEVMRDIAYSTAFFWADLIFHTQDRIVPTVTSELGIAIQDRYDLSIVSYRQAHDYHWDHVMLEGFLQRKLILTPKLTVFLDADFEVVRERILRDENSTEIDRGFIGSPDRFRTMQRSIRDGLASLNRESLELDTGMGSPAECLSKILQRMEL